MTLTKTIQEAVKSKNVIIGYKKSIKFIKLNKPKLVIVAENAPEKIKEEIENSTKIARVKVKIFNGTSKELGIISGKPFPITTLVIK